MTPIAYVVFTCGRDAPLVRIALQAAQRVAPPGSTITVFVDEKDPIEDRSLEALGLHGLRVLPGNNGGRHIDGTDFVASQLQLYREVLSQNPSAAYLHKLDSDVLLLRDTVGHIRDTERFMLIGTAGRAWESIWGASYYLHRAAAEALAACDFDLLLERVRERYWLHHDHDELHEDEFIGKATATLYGEAHVYFREPTPWVEGWFDAFHFDQRDGEMGDECKGRFFDAVEFGRREELPPHLSDDAKVEKQREAMQRVWEKHRDGTWKRWAPAPPDLTGLVRHHDLRRSA